MISSPRHRGAPARIALPQRQLRPHHTRTIGSLGHRDIPTQTAATQWQCRPDLRLGHRPIGGPLDHHVRTRMTLRQRQLPPHHARSISRPIRHYIPARTVIPQRQLRPHYTISSPRHRCASTRNALRQRQLRPHHARTTGNPLRRDIPIRATATQRQPPPQRCFGRRALGGRRHRGVPA